MAYPVVVPTITMVMFVIVPIHDRLLMTTGRGLRAEPAGGCGRAVW